jgi:hypothetical protein
MVSPLSDKALDALAKLREHGELQKWKKRILDLPRLRRRSSRRQRQLQVWRL